MQLYTRDKSPYWWAEFFVRGSRHRFSTKRLLNDKAAQLESHDVMTEARKYLNA